MKCKKITNCNKKYKNINISILNLILETYIDHIINDNFYKLKYELLNGGEQNNANKFEQFKNLYLYINAQIKKLVLELSQCHEFEFNYSTQIFFTSSNNVIYYYTLLNIRKSYSQNKYILTLSTEDESETNLRNMFVNFINGQNPINISFMTLFLSKLPKENKWTQYPNKLGDWNFYSKYTGSTVTYSSVTAPTYTITTVNTYSNTSQPSPYYNDTISFNNYGGIEIYNGDINIKWTNIPSGTYFTTLVIGIGGMCWYPSTSGRYMFGSGGGGGIIWYPSSLGSSENNYLQNGTTNIIVNSAVTNVPFGASQITNYDSNNNFVSQMTAYKGGDGLIGSEGGTGGLTSTTNTIKGIQYNGGNGGNGGLVGYANPTNGTNSGIINVQLPYNNSKTYVGGGAGGNTFNSSEIKYYYGVGGYGYGGAGYGAQSTNGGIYTSSNGGTYGGGSCTPDYSYGIVSLSWNMINTGENGLSINLTNNNNSSINYYQQNGWDVYEISSITSTSDVVSYPATGTLSFSTDSTISLILVGGGGSGGNSKGEHCGGGGAGGNTTLFYNISVTAGTLYNYTVGSGGNATSSGSQNGQATSITINGLTYQSAGGNGGNNGTSSGSGTGGTGSTNGGFGGNGGMSVPTAGQNGSYLSYLTEYGSTLSVGGGGGGGIQNKSGVVNAGYGYAGANGVGGNPGVNGVIPTNYGRGIGYGAGGGGASGFSSDNSNIGVGSFGSSGFIVIYINALSLN